MPAAPLAAPPVELAPAPPVAEGAPALLLAPALGVAPAVLPPPPDPAELPLSQATPMMMTPLNAPPASSQRNAMLERNFIFDSLVQPAKSNELSAGFRARLVQSERPA